MQIWRYALAHEVRWVTLSVQGTACTSCAAAADAVRVGAGTLVVFGDYQIAPIAARSTAMGRWRLTPPGYGGTCLPAGRSAGLTVSFNTANPPGGRLGRCGGRREKHLPWLGQAAAEASAPVSVHAVLLTDNGDERLCPREYTGNHCRP